MRTPPHSYDASEMTPLCLTRFGDGNRSFGLVVAALGCVLDLLNNIVTVNDFAKDAVLAIEPTSDCGGDEELGAWKQLSTC